jgi:hypothetical protein
LLQQVAGGSSIYVRGQGIDNSIFDATIDITGVDEAIKRVTADCNFKP